jgi:hypothetical protein
MFVELGDAAFDGSGITMRSLRVGDGIVVGMTSAVRRTSGSCFERVGEWASGCMSGQRELGPIPSFFAERVLESGCRFHQGQITVFTVSQT